ncbi:hypothetical protein SCP_0800440 [Sparassis crispa]|uniref:Uncharacterized protein n=1 Tax=Sparassis crispa TaxID=139825 RepID=A0A401GTI7_9APHY|nr:hypothetical protein SCP_0800440 [Sparassis crispa]GBE85527.1 hypothetical protein SCP_0800440 [Sparassis crispa]
MILVILLDKTFMIACETFHVSRLPHLRMLCWYTQKAHAPSSGQHHCIVQRLISHVLTDNIFSDAKLVPSLEILLTNICLFSWFHVGFAKSNVILRNRPKTSQGI